MKKASLVVLLLICASFTTISILPERASANTLYVGGGGPGNYTTIQAAVDNASSGDIVYVYSGTYYENVVVSKTITLVGEDRNSTVINGDGTGIVLYISADWVNVTDLTTTKSGSSRTADAGIKLHIATHCYIANNTVVGNENGILLLSASHNTIKGNAANDNNGSGIRIQYSQSNNVTANVLSGNLDGILIADQSRENTIADNSVNGNVEGIYLVHSYDSTVAFNQVTQNVDTGIRISSSSRNSVTHNEVHDNHHGIELQESSWVNVTNNNVLRGREGISLDSCDNSTISNNTVSLSNLTGIRLWGSENNSVYHNNFIDNERQAIDYPYDVNHWDDGYPSGGNYWSDYDDTDRKSGSQQDSPGGDGIGDAPYDIKTGFISCCPVHEGTGSKDAYPLMSPFVQPPLNDPNEPPACTIETPLAEASVSGIQTIGGSAYDSGGIMERVEIRVDDGEWVRAIGTITWSFDWDTETVPNGDHVIYARSYDGMDYSEETSVFVNVDNPMVYEEVWFWSALVLGLVILVTVVVVLMRKK